ncbi:MAG: preprotein translocase subunit SecY [Patescibacteria group bacterium]|jgi:preprotein translocase subunit SecY
MNYFTRLFKNSELRRRILITLGLLFLTRLLVHVPLSAVSTDSLRNFFSNNSNSAFGLLDIFSGGSLSKFSIILMGVGPYITASIIIQLMTIIVPSLEALQKEGDYGRQRINQYTRYLTIPLAVIQGYATLILLRSEGIISGWNTPQLLEMLIVSTAGTILLMWLGEIISENGVGNGISLIITIGILSSIPNTFYQKYSLVVAGGSIDMKELFSFAAFILASLILIAVIVLMNDALRKIPVTYARRLQGTSNDSVNSFLPIKVNTAGVIPIIFAISMLMFPQIIGQFFGNAKTEWVREAAGWITANISSTGNPTLYGILYFVLVIVFTFFYTSIIFNPKQIAENLQKQSGFIPGIRPGGETAAYIGKIVSRVTFVGSIFLGLVAVLPVIVPLMTGDQTLILGGTGILIVVSVVIETMRQIDAQLVMTSYDKY